MKITIKEFKTITGFALIGVVLSGVVFGLFGSNPYIEELKLVSGVISVGLAKYYHFF